MRTTQLLVRLLLGLPVMITGLWLIIQGPAIYLQETKNASLYQSLQNRSHYVVPELNGNYTWEEVEGTPVYRLSYQYTVGDVEYSGESYTRQLPVWDRAELYYLPEKPHISALDPQLTYHRLLDDNTSLLTAILVFTLTFAVASLILLRKIWHISLKQSASEIPHL
ncbi:hypothetical protein [Endozoicomonas sp. OPT23]|uniref:hypothetical protein n=1 Tax=Endozoicomonas sp. OPT23 TaxID=2072845 RepID=UPI00129BB298|nr:hypothetical protein [Endozoicomonas sp. OPT23]